MASNRPLFDGAFKGKFDANIRKIYTFILFAWVSWIILSITMNSPISPGFLNPSRALIFGIKIGYVLLLLFIPVIDWVRKSAYAK